MGNLKSRWSLLKKWQAKLGNVNRISDCRLSASGRNSGAHTWQKVHMPFGKISLASLYSDFIIWKTESIALNRNQTWWIITQKFCLIHWCSFTKKRPCANYCVRARMHNDSFQSSRPKLEPLSEEEIKLLPSSCSSLPLKALRKLPVLTTLHYSSNAVWGNSKHTDWRPEMRVASCLQF